MGEVLEVGEFMGLFNINFSLGIIYPEYSPEKDSAEIELLLRLYQLWTMNKLNFYQVVEAKGNYRKVENYFPKMDKETFMVEKYNGMIFKRREIENNREELKKMLGLETHNKEKSIDVRNADSYNVIIAALINKLGKSYRVNDKNWQSEMIAFITSALTDIGCKLSPPTIRACLKDMGASVDKKSSEKK